VYLPRAFRSGKGHRTTYSSADRSRRTESRLSFRAPLLPQNGGLSWPHLLHESKCSSLSGRFAEFSNHANVGERKLAADPHYSLVRKNDPFVLDMAINCPTKAAGPPGPDFQMSGRQSLSESQTQQFGSGLILGLHVSLSTHNFVLVSTSSGKYELIPNWIRRPEKAAGKGALNTIQGFHWLLLV
jgi:hypothetical protein